jgi:hypothetical protein
MMSSSQESPRPQSLTTGAQAEQRHNRTLGWLQKLAVQAAGSTSKNDPIPTLRTLVVEAI